MSRGICLRIALLLALAITALQALVSARNLPEGAVEQIDWPDAFTGCWAHGLLQAYNTEGDDTLRGFVARTDLAVCLRVGSVAAPPCFGLVWGTRDLIMCKDRKEVMR